MEGPIPPSPSDPRFRALPRSLAERAVWARLAEGRSGVAGGFIPALLAHPDLGWSAPGGEPTPRPVVIWMHGRTVNKELDPGRYLRWLRAPNGGIAACAIDLPWHGERADPSHQTAASAGLLIEQTVREIDLVVEALRDPRWNGAFDTSRIAIGGMSAGGMATLVRLCAPHRFACAAVEASAGDLSLLGRDFAPETLAKINPISHLDGWSPIPVLALHSKADAWVPFAAMETFITRLRDHYHARGGDPSMIEFVFWDRTGAPEEHMGFGERSNEAKNLQTDFFTRRLTTPA